LSFDIFDTDNIGNNIGDDWYSTSKKQDQNPLSNEPYEYCERCYLLFKKYNECINNVCQSCGLPADFMKNSRQQVLKATAINAPINKNFTKGTSLVIDYSPLLDEGDESIASNKLLRDGEVMESGFGPGHAMQLIRDVEAQAAMRTRSVSTGQPYLLKTTYKEKQVKFDERTDD